MISESYEEFVLESGKGNLASYISVKRDGAGKIPESLGGMYTSVNAARKAVDEYKRTLKPRMSKADG